MLMDIYQMPQTKLGISFKDLILTWQTLDQNKTMCPRSYVNPANQIILQSFRTDCGLSVVPSETIVKQKEEQLQKLRNKKKINKTQTELFSMSTCASILS